MLHTIKDGNLSVTVNDEGAEFVNIVYNGKEKLWQNDNGSWAGHAPVFFPACGRCAVVLDGKFYSRELHGFAQRKKFTVSEKSENLIRLTLVSDKETLALYPFEFQLDFVYRVEKDTLYITHEVYNASNAPMPCAFGGHESFALDNELGDYELRFEKSEKFLSLTHNDGGILNGGSVDLGEGDVFVFPEEFFQEGATAIFKNVNSRFVTLCKRGGDELAAVKFDGFSNLLLWRPEGAKTICIEPWQNLPDAEGEENKNFDEKYGVHNVAPKEKLVFNRSIRYLK